LTATTATVIMGAWRMRFRCLEPLFIRGGRSMPFTVACDQCGQQYRVKEHLAGKEVKCKACGHAFRVPGRSTPDETEVSESGSLILRHAPRDRELELAPGCEEEIEQISAHLEKHLGKVEMVFHEIVSDLVHLDVHWIAPTLERDFHTFVTSGMSDRPMSVPEGADELRYAELLISLPSDWPISMEAFEDERNYWPIRWLKQLARLPHEYETWLGVGHTVPNGDPPEPFSPDTKLCCWLLMPPLLVPEEFSPLVTSEEKTVHFYAIVPLYNEEVNFKLKRGLEALIDPLSRAEVSELLDLGRKNVCKRRFWPF
jgi:predicted Zn finger-like uncharacterized protein